MDIAKTHPTPVELEQGMAHVLASPTDRGRLAAIFVRPETGRRQQLDVAQLSLDAGVNGDRWATNHWKTLPDGRSDPSSQISLMNARVLELVAGGDAAMHLAGDNLILDLDLSDHNLPAGSRLQVGADVVLEMTAEEHTGCGKFARRFGHQAREFVNRPHGHWRNLRGRFARVIVEGDVHVGDVVAVLHRRDSA